MRRVLWSCGLAIVVACGSTRTNPKPEGASGSASAGSAGAQSSAAGHSAAEPGGGEANGGSAGAGGTRVAEEPTPAPLSPLLPQDDMTARIECPGPSPLDHWQFPSSPQPRAVLAVDPKSSSTFYGQLTSALPSGAPSAFSAWLLRTDDGGATWCQLDLPEPLHELVVSPAERSVLYAAGFTHYYRSADYGNSWQKGAPVGGGRVVAHETQVDTLYEIGTKTRRSVDGGLSWEVAGGAELVQEIAFAEDGREILYGVSPPCILHRSSDWGRTWRKFPIANGCINSLPTRPLLVSSGVIYLTEWGEGQTWLHSSSDNGEHWERTEELSFEAGQPLSFRGDAPGVLYMRDSSGVQRSTDYGQTWSAHLTVPDGGHLSTLGPRAGVFHAADSLDLSLLSLDDGESWTTTAIAREGTVHTSAADPEYVYIAGAHWLYRSVDGGKSFESLAWPYKGAGPRRLVVARYDARLVATSGGNYWAVSTSGGNTWPPWSPNINGVIGPAFFQSLTFDPSSHGTWYATMPGAKLLMSSSAGGWFNDMATSDPAREVVPAAAHSTFRRVYALAGDLDAPVLTRTDNGGITWMDACRPPDICPISVDVHKDSPPVLVGVGSDKTSGVARPVLMSSQDSGVTWTRHVVAAGASWRTFFGSNQNPIAWSSLDHAYRSTDLGVTWSRFSVPVAGEVARDYSSFEGVFVNNGGLWRFQQ